MKEKTTVALGTFDGLHLGHKAVLLSALKFKETRKIVITFSASSVKKGAEQLLPENKKNDMLYKMGFDEVYTLDFDAVKNTTAENFLSELFKNNDIAALCCGFNYRFGKGALGDTELIKTFCENKGATAVIASPVEYKNEPISSSRIRNALKEGNITDVNEMLGYNYFLESIVVGGDERGRRLGFPTANQPTEETTALPKYGVYSTKAIIKNKEYRGITNIGIRPTYEIEKPSAETFLLNFDGNLYGEKIKIEFLEFLREERKFDSFEELQQQIKKDIEKIK